MPNTHLEVNNCIENLPNEYNLDKKLIQKFGVTEAFIINFLKMIINYTASLNKYFYQNNYWTRCSMAQFQKYLFFLSEFQIRNSLDHLVEMKILKRGNFNSNPFDKTYWYCFENPQEFIKLPNVLKEKVYVFDPSKSKKTNGAHTNFHNIDTEISNEQHVSNYQPVMENKETEVSILKKLMPHKVIYTSGYINNNNIIYKNTSLKVPNENKRISSNDEVVNKFEKVNKKFEPNVQKLIGKLLELKPDVRLSSMEVLCKTYALMVHRDKRSEEKMENLFLYAINDPFLHDKFFIPNPFSYFRLRFDQIDMRYKQVKKEDCKPYVNDLEAIEYRRQRANNFANQNFKRIRDKGHDIYCGVDFVRFDWDIRVYYNDKKFDEMWKHYLKKMGF